MAEPYETGPRPPNQPGTRIMLAQAPPRPRRRARRKTKTTAKTGRRNINVCDKLSDVLLNNVPAKTEKIRENRVKAARKSIIDALRYIKYFNPKTRKAVKSGKLKLECADYYLAIAIKESSLNPAAKSYKNDPNKGALGYFQLMLDKGKVQALTAVKKRFGIDYDKDDIYPKDDTRRLIRLSSKKNAIAGILYWHILRDEVASTPAVRAKRKWKLDLPAADRDKIAAISYNLGPTAVDRLWNHFKPKNFKELGQKIATAIVKKYPRYVAQPATADKTAAYLDPTYKIGYQVYMYEKAKLPRASEGKTEKTIKIGSHSYRIRKLIGTLRYTELIYSMMHGGPATTDVLPKPTAKPAAPPKTLPKPPVGPKPKPPVTPPVGPTLPIGGIDPMGRYEVTGNGQWLWGIAAKLLKECKDSYRIPYCIDPDVSRKEKIRLLTEILIKYNREIDNEQFDHLSDDHDIKAIGRGTKVYFPNKKYIEEALKQSETEVETEPLPPVPEVLKRKGYYAGPDQSTADKWHKMGREKFKRSKKPKIVTPKIRVKKKGKWVVEEIDTGKRSPHGRMPRSKVRGIVLHTTEGSHVGLYRNQGIHYVLRKDGTIELIRNHDIAIDHAGRMANSRSKAMWRGDKNPSLHTVGIEIVNDSLPKMVREGKVVIKAKKADVKSKKIGGKTVYYATKAPSKTALRSGYKQALKARALTDKQYAALQKFIPWLGHELRLRKRDVWTHSMIATSRFGRGRKSDPPVLNWKRLNLPDNHWQIDTDVVAKRVLPNDSKIEKDRKGKDLKMRTIGGKKVYELIKIRVGGKDVYTYLPNAGFGAESAITSGVKAAVKIRKENEAAAARRRRRRR